VNGGRRAPTFGGNARRDRDAGTVTGELAVGLAGVVVVLGAVLAAVLLGQQQLRAVDAAAAGARAVARGASDAEAAALARRLAGHGANGQARREGELVTVTVRVPVALPLPGTPTITVAGVARTPAEPQVGGAG
jgi:hypothetical protein